MRGDEILWLDQASASKAQRVVLGRLERLRDALNRELQLGAVELELHFAVYPAGAAYAVHVDRFRDADARVLSLVLYLNEAWSEADGGELRLYLGPDRGRRSSTSSRKAARSSSSSRTGSRTRCCRRGASG